MQSLVILLFINNTNINIVCVVFDQIQIWNASNNGNVGDTVCDPFLSERVTCNTDPWSSVSSIHGIAISSCVPATVMLLLI